MFFSFKKANLSKLNQSTERSWGSGIVVEGENQPQSDINVVIEGTDLSALTDSNGNYSITRVSIRTYGTVLAYTEERGSNGVNLYSVAIRDGQGRVGVYLPTSGKTVTLPTLVSNA